MRAWGSARAEFSRQSCAEGAGLCRTAWDGGAAFIAERRSHDLFSDLVCISRSAIAAEILPPSSQRLWAAGMLLLAHPVAKLRLSSSSLRCSLILPSHLLRSLPQPYGQTRFLPRSRRCSLSRGQGRITGIPPLQCAICSVFTPNSAAL